MCLHAAYGPHPDLQDLAVVARLAPSGWRTVVIDATDFHDAGA